MLPLWLLPSVAHALSCEEIMNMLDVNVPVGIVVQVIEDSTDTFTRDELQCLVHDGADTQVIQQVRAQLEKSAAEPSRPSRRDGPITQMPGVIFRAPVEHTAAAAAAGVHGRVDVVVTIDTNGDVTKAEVDGQGLGYGMDAAVERAVRQFHFSPARDQYGPREFTFIFGYEVSPPAERPRSVSQRTTTAQSHHIARQTALSVMQRSQRKPVVVTIRAKGTLPEWFDPLTYRQELLSALPPGSRAVEQEVDPVRIIDHADAPALRAILARRDYHALLYIELQPQVERLDVFYEMWMLQDGDRHVRTQYLDYEMLIVKEIEPVTIAGRIPQTITTTSSPAPIRDAEQLLDAGQHMEATMRLFPMLESGRYPEHEGHIYYLMGTALSKQGLYISAQHHLRQALSKGISSTDFDSAFAQLINIAYRTGDDLELENLVLSNANVLLGELPTSQHPEIHYLSGIQQYEAGDLETAIEMLSRVPRSSPRYRAARYILGVIYNEQGKLKSAVRQFRDAYAHSLSGYTAQYADAIHTQDLALLNIARVYYSIEQYDKAHKFASLLSEDTPLAGRPQLEDAWALFMMDNLAAASRVLDSLKATRKKPAAYEPEAEILRALILFQRGEYTLAEQRLLDFELTIGPIQDELENFATSLSAVPGPETAGAWVSYFGPSSTQLSPALLDHLTRDRGLRGVKNRLRMMDAETEALTRTHGLIRKKTHPWQDQLGVYLRGVITDERERLKQSAGLLLLDAARREANRLKEFNTQSEIIRFELTEATRPRVEY